MPPTSFVMAPGRRRCSSGWAAPAAGRQLPAAAPKSLPQPATPHGGSVRGVIHPNRPGSVQPDPKRDCTSAALRRRRVSGSSCLRITAFRFPPHSAGRPAMALTKRPPGCARVSAAHPNCLGGAPSRVHHACGKPLSGSRHIPKAAPQWRKRNGLRNVPGFPPPPAELQGRRRIRNCRYSAPLQPMWEKPPGMSPAAPSQTRLMERRKRLPITPAITPARTESSAVSGWLAPALPWPIAS